MNPLANIGRGTFSMVRGLGFVTLFGIRGAFSWLTGPFYWRAFLKQLVRIGFTSLPVVGLTAIFTGAALALNIYDGSARFNAETFLPQILGISIVRELGPGFAALMVSGRCASAMAAEIGTMRVTEQIDAMTTLDVDPINYLITPRILATVITLPLLVLVSDLVGVYGGYLVAVNALDFDGVVYLQNMRDFLTMADVTSGLIKAAVFGFLIALMGCYYGFRSEGGAQGVGAATRIAVVSSAVLILSSNFLMTSLFVDF